MSKILMDKIHARCKELVEEKGIDLDKIKEENLDDPQEGSVWLEYIRCFFQGARDVQDEMQRLGLTSTVKALTVIIAQQRKMMRRPAEMKVISEVLDYEELT